MPSLQFRAGRCQTCNFQYGVRMTRRAEYREEIKTRMRPAVATALRKFKSLNGFDSDSAALNRVAELFLLGVIGTLPEDDLGVSAEVGHPGPRSHA